MEEIKYLIGIYNKQLPVIEKIFDQIRNIDLSNSDKQYVFSLKAQQLYTAVEELMKFTAKSFENHIHDATKFHSELLRRLSVDVPGIRPALISDRSYQILDKMRSFRHFIRHAYDYELDAEEIKFLQHKLNTHFENVINDIKIFIKFLDDIAQ